MLTTDRLELHLLDDEALRAVADGDRRERSWHDEFPRADDSDAARMTRRHPHPMFGCYAIVERATGLAVGTIGFFGPPDESGTVIVGYGLVAPARGAGYATEALRALVGFALRQDGVQRVEADPLRANVASHRVLEKSGFVRSRSTATAQWFTAERAG